MPLPFLAAVPAAIAATKTTVHVGGAAATCIYYSFFHEENLPEMIDEIDNNLNEIHADSDALVINVAERSQEMKEKDDEVYTRLDEVVTRLGLEVTTMEEREVIPVVPLPESHTEALQRLTDVQSRMSAGIDRQQVDIAAIADKLNDLPALLRVNQENKALRLRNKKLEANIDALENQLEETTRCLKETNELAKEQQEEIDEQRVEIETLQKQSRAQNSVENKENTSSVSFFLRN